MNEDGQTPAAAPDAGDDNVETGAVTADDVAQVLHLPQSEPEATNKEEGDDADQPSDTEGDDGGDDAAAAPGADDPKEPPADDKQQPSETPDKPAGDEQPAEVPTFTVEIEDANGNKFTVSPDDNLEEVLKDFEPTSNGQVLQLMRDLDRLSNEKAAYDAEQAEKADQAAHEKVIADIQAGFDSEVARLQGEKRLPVTTDGKDSDRLTEVYKFMTEENTKRAEEGRQLIRSIEDALDKLELRERKEAEAQAKKDAKATARKNGSLVGGSSAPAASGGPSYAGGARNATDALRSMGLLN